MSDSWSFSSTRGFRVDCHQREDATVVECYGKLTLENAPLLRSEAKGVMGQTKRFVLDLKEVPMIDSTGLGAIVGLYVSARTKGMTFELVNANRQIRELFGISKLLILFEPAGRYGGKIL